MSVLPCYTYRAIALESIAINEQQRQKTEEKRKKKHNTTTITSTRIITITDCFVMLSLYLIWHYYCVRFFVSSFTTPKNSQCSFFLIFQMRDILVYVLWFFKMARRFCENPNILLVFWEIFELKWKWNKQTNWIFKVNWNGSFDSFSITPFTNTHIHTCSSDLISVSHPDSQQTYGRHESQWAANNRLNIMQTSMSIRQEIWECGNNILCAAYALYFIHSTFISYLLDLER